MCRNSGNQVGLLGNRPSIVSPWESGVAPGMLQQQAALLNTYGQPASLMPMQTVARVSIYLLTSYFLSIFYAFYQFLNSLAK